MTERRRGRPPYPGTFTPAEQRVLEGLRRGETYQRIADDLGVSYDTVKYHVSNMLAKAQVESRDDLVAYSRQPGLRWLALPSLWGWVAGAAAVVLVGAAIVAVLSTRGSDDEPAAPDDTPTPAASPTVPATPTVPVTGVPIVDEFIAAVRTGDMTNIEPLIQYGAITCRTSPEPGIGSPPQCPPGQPDQSAVPGIVGGGGCHGGYILEADMRQTLRDWNLGFQVFSVSEFDQSGTDVILPVRYVVVVAFTQFADGSRAGEPLPGLEFRLRPEGVIGWSGWCGQSARALSTRNTNYLVPPPPLPPVPPGTPRSGVAPVDQLIDAVVVGDLLALREHTLTIDVGCGEQSGRPPCRQEQAPGTPVPAVVREICDERSFASPAGLAEDYAFRLGRDPVIAGIARGDGRDGVAFWVIWKGDGPAGALGVTDTGRIAVIDNGCDGDREGGLPAILAKHTDYLYRAS